MVDKQTHPAKVVSPDVGFEDHGIFTIFARFDYGNGEQGIGYGWIDLEFIKRFIRACGVDTLSRCAGRIVMVTHTNEAISKIEPMKFEEGEAFDLDAWAARVRKRRKE